MPANLGYSSTPYVAAHPDDTTYLDNEESMVMHCQDGWRWETEPLMSNAEMQCEFSGDINTGFEVVGEPASYEQCRDPAG